MRKLHFAIALLLSLAFSAGAKSPVEYVNPYIGNISHMLVPTFPTIQLPNSMLRVYPERADYTTELLSGLPIIVTNHRERSAFNLSPYQGEQLKPINEMNYDNEVLTPYSYSAELCDNSMAVEFALSHQSAIYKITFDAKKPAYIIMNSRGGKLQAGKDFISGYQRLSRNTCVYLYIEPQEKPVAVGAVADGKIGSAKQAEGKNACIAWQFAKGTKSVSLRYGISFISEEQAKANLRREQKDYDVKALAELGKKIWNDELGKITVEGGSEDQKTVLYTSFYRTFERPICMSEDGKYFSGFDGKVHNDNGTPFYTDDWIWDTYRAAHPLRIITNQKIEENILNSFILMAEQMGTNWLPTFPETTGDSRRMNSNHTVATFADAMVKGIKVDVAKAYEYGRKVIEEKSLAPWSPKPANYLSKFYLENGYVPALAEGEEECDPTVSEWELRQPVAVTLGTSYDQWCLSLLASKLGKKDEAKKYDACARNYRNVFKHDTGFFHPKDKDGNWIEPFDYRFSGGTGARNAYDENNGWVYRWDVQHNVGDLINLMGGREKFVENLDQTFAEPLGKGKWQFYMELPDQTGNVGQFSMANEPSLHIPYLYNYAGAPWRTQKRIRQLLKTWFRNDVMGVPGDEDGGGLTSFVVFSSLGFYPVTPGSASYNIGSPLFTNAKVQLSNGKVFEIVAENASDVNKYIQSATLNGKTWDKPWFSHKDLMEGGKLVLVMGDKPNKQWGAAASAMPPSLDK